jgi:hypothetical protein
MRIEHATTRALDQVKGTAGEMDDEKHRQKSTSATRSFEQDNFRGLENES